jgi:putative membrane protein
MWWFWLLLIVVIAWAVKVALPGGADGGKDAKSPLQILEERFARGEIDEEEFERKRKLLGH